MHRPIHFRNFLAAYGSTPSLLMMFGAYQALLCGLSQAYRRAPFLSKMNAYNLLPAARLVEPVIGPS